MTFGALGLAIGFPGAYYLLHGSASGDALHRPARDRGRRRPARDRAGDALEGAPHRRKPAADATSAGRWRRSLGAVAALVIFAFVVFPIGFSYGYTHIGRTGPLADLGVPYETVTVHDERRLELAAAYVPSKNRAAIVVFPGARP